MGRAPNLIPVETPKGWMVSLPPAITATGKRVRKFFPTKAKADRYAAGVRGRYHKGERGLLTADQAMEARAALKILAPINVGLVEAARLAVEAHQDPAGDQVFRERWREYQDRMSPHWRPRYAAEVAKLDRWLGPLADRPCRELTESAITAALRQSGKVGPAVLARRLTITKAVLSGRGKRRRAAAVEILTASQLRAMLRACEGPEERRVVALLIFAGIRPDPEDGEITRLDWSAVGESEIYVSEEVSKTGTDRHIPLTPRLRRLLRGRPAEGQVRPANWKRKWSRIRKASEVTATDITRHTFASNFLVAFGEDAAKAAMGHTEKSRTLFRHYRRSVTEAAARAFFRLR